MTGLLYILNRNIHFKKQDVTASQLELELIFNDAEAITETLYVVELTEKDVIQARRWKRKGKREEDIKDLPVEVYKRVRVQPAVYTV